VTASRVAAAPLRVATHHAVDRAASLPSRRDVVVVGGCGRIVGTVQQGPLAERLTEVDGVGRVRVALTVLIAIPGRDPESDHDRLVAEADLRVQDPALRRPAARALHLTDQHVDRRALRRQVSLTGGLPHRQCASTASARSQQCDASREQQHPRQPSWPSVCAHHHSHPVPFPSAVVRRRTPRPRVRFRADRHHRQPGRGRSTGSCPDQSEPCSRGRPAPLGSLATSHEQRRPTKARPPKRSARSTQRAARTAHDHTPAASCWTPVQRGCCPCCTEGLRGSRPHDRPGQGDGPQLASVRRQGSAIAPPCRPAGVPPIPAISIDLPMPARRTRRRPRHLHPTARAQPDIDGDIEHECDLHRVLLSAHDPRTLGTSRGSTTFTNATASPTSPRNRNPA
jgi:hypothetical protein